MFLFEFFQNVHKKYGKILNTWKFLSFRLFRRRLKYIVYISGKGCNSASATEQLVMTGTEDA